MNVGCEERPNRSHLNYTCSSIHSNDLAITSDNAVIFYQFNMMFEKIIPSKEQWATFIHERLLNWYSNPGGDIYIYPILPFISRLP